MQTVMKTHNAIIKGGVITFSFMVLKDDIFFIRRKSSD